MTLLSRVLGLVRDVVIAHLIGAGAAADVFLFANRIPNFLRRLFAEEPFLRLLSPFSQNINNLVILIKPVNLLEKFLVPLGIGEYCYDPRNGWIACRCRFIWDGLVHRLDE